MSDFIFSVRPIPYRDESLLGLLKRHVKVSGLRSLSVLATQFGLPSDVRSIPTAKEMPALLKAYGSAGRALEQMRLRPIDGRRIQYRGHVLPRSDICVGHMRFCPYCVAATRYHRQHWNLASIAVCHIHRVKLIDRCTTCGDTFSWQRDDLDWCSSCKRSTAHGVIQKASDWAVDATAALMSLFDGEDPSDASLPDVLRHLPAAEVVDFLCLLGRMACGTDGVASKPGRPLAWPHADQVIARGFQIACDWPRAFEAILAKMTEGAVENVDNLQVLFGSHYRAMLKTPSPGWGDRVLPVFSRFVQRSLGRAIPKLGGLAGNDDGLTSESKLRTLLALSGPAFKKLKETDLWATIKPIKRGSRAIFGDTDVVTVRSAIGGSCNAKAMGGMLGLHVKKQIKAIVDHGLFGLGETTLDGRARFVDASAVDRFLKRLEGAVTKASVLAKPCRLVDWDELRAMASERKISLSELLSLMNEGHIEPLAGDVRNGLRNLRFSRDLVVAALDRVVAKAEKSVSIRELAGMLEVSPRVAYALVKDGYLPSAKTGCRVNGMRVPDIQVAAFMAKHVSVGEISRRKDISGRELRRRLVNDNAKPSVSFPKDGAQFFLRRDLEGLRL